MTLKCQELGALDGPVLLFGGPYSNRQALQAVIAQAQARGIGPERMICTGDLVAYCASPAETVTRVRALGNPVVAGNCEAQLAAGAPDCGCGFEEGSACDLLSNAWYPFAQRQLSPDDLTWMAGLPDVITFTQRGQRFAVIHGGVRDVAHFIWSSTPDAVLEAEWDILVSGSGDIDGIVAGHSGIPFVRRLSRGDWINAGVIGMPPHDGRRETCFAVLENGAVHLERLRYDAEAAAEDMARASLPDGYRLGLLSGYWPSEDVLPPDLRVPLSARG